MSHHDTSHLDTGAHDPAAHGDGHAHSHKKHYIRIGVILTVVTAIELGIPFIKDGNPTLWNDCKELWAPLLVALSVFKFGAVVGEFMHLRGDDRVYKVVFISPLILAMLSFFVLGLMAVTHFGPFGEGVAITNVDVAMGYRKASKGAEAPPAPPEDKLKLAFDDLAKTGHDKGNAIFAAKCASCHGDHGEGKQGLGPNFTDNCYIHGGKLANLYTTIRNGVSGKAMPAWGTQLKGEEIQQVASYVRSLRGTNAPGGQPCQGEPVND